jgi:LmbE family N-acetylglucosaminyl deacetylase/GT2 family glycosyltransferase
MLPWISKRSIANSSPPFNPPTPPPVKGLYPLYGDPASLPDRVLVVAPHPDDEVMGAGGMLALHARLGHTVRVVILTDGGQGDPDARTTDLKSTRVQESLNAGAVLGISDYRFLTFTDGKLGESEDLGEALREEIEAFDPGLIYAPSPQELHPDHRAASRGLMAAVGGGKERRIFLYGVNSQVAAGIMFNVTDVYAQKRAAIECFLSQLEYMPLVRKGEAVDGARTVNVEDPAVEYIEGFADLPSTALGRYERSVADLLQQVQGAEGSVAEAMQLPQTTAVISTWNKVDVLRENLDSLRAQSLPFAKIIVVDNGSKDETARVVADEYPEVRLIVMPHSEYGACETFNIGFASATTELVAILDDDIVLPRTWLEETTRRMQSEPESTAVVSTEIIEPGMTAEYIANSKAAGVRYMSTFRGCGSLAKRAAIKAAGFYDERLFIYGNERDLTCRLLNLGLRVLQDPGIETFHKTPFGIQMGKRSLFYHARNAWLSMLKYAPMKDLMRLPFLVVTKVLMNGGSDDVAGSEKKKLDATGTLGLGKSIRATKGAYWTIFKAGLSVLYNVPYCLKRRQPVQAEDFELPLG